MLSERARCTTFLALFVSTCLIVQLVNAGTSLIDRSDEIKYSIALLAPKDTKEIPSGGTVHRLTSGSNKRQYDCTVPAPLENVDQENTTSAAPSFDDLLEPLSNSCLYRLAGWWTYEFCFGRHLRQYHQEFDKPVREGEEFFLGKTQVLPGVGHKEYYAVTYTGGTPCDITHEPRSVEVQFICSPDQIPSAIIDIKEPASCTYIVQVATNLVCRHPTLRPKKEKVQTIYCVPVPPTPVQSEESLPATHGLPQGTFSTGSAEHDETNIMLDPSMQEIAEIFSAELKDIKGKRSNAAAADSSGATSEATGQQRMQFHFGDSTVVIDGEALTVDELRQNLRSAMAGSQMQVDNVQLEELVQEIQRELNTNLDKHAKPNAPEEEPKQKNQGFQIHGAKYAKGAGASAQAQSNSKKKKKP
eukprot:TRINITY_DN10864_c0_g1_i1.p1 TRINITY_DN10864_c0_g1~~TRINITY_DN10864_c0_g1_i1.p1  ORF type:complete len:415 (-),score=136.73 TRINITY_DN10864_c0_g1_i1:77-1321(-)